ncbi:MAG TPA: cadmium resistance transporter [Chryseosolibacter sp.]
MIPHIGLAVITFVITNIDDLLILSVYFAAPTYRGRNIVVGQFFGIIAIIIISLVGVVLGNFLSDRWISLLGVLPIIVGVKELLTSEGEEADDVSVTKSNFQFLNVALVTIANGGDNIGVYIPLFASLPDFSFVVMYIIVFILLTAVLCYFAYYLTNHPKIKHYAAIWGHKILPYFLILLGLYILKDFVIDLL